MLQWQHQFLTSQTSPSKKKYTYFSVEAYTTAFKHPAKITICMEKMRLLNDCLSLNCIPPCEKTLLMTLIPPHPIILAAV